MTNRATGWVVFAAAMGMMFGLLAVDVTQLNTWHEATTPAFIGSMLAHLGATLTAFVGGKLIPAEENT